MESISRTYRIPEERIEAVTKKLKALSRKGEKLGTGAISYELKGSEIEEHVGEEGSKVFVRVVLLTVSGTAPAIAGYKFLGTITPAPGGNGNLFSGIPGQGKVPEGLVNGPLTCDHCKTTRVRKNVFLVQSETDGAFLKVGRNCLKDFLGGTDPNSVAATAEYLVTLELDLSEAEDIGNDFLQSAPPLWDIETFLALTVEDLRTRPYVSREVSKNGGGTATADSIIHLLTPPKGSGIPVPKPKADCVEEARVLLQWVLAQSPDSDYMRNLHLLVEGQVIDRRTAGYVASVPGSYQRFLEREARDRLPKGTGSGHVGKVGERLDIAGTVTALKVIDSVSQWSNVATLVKVVDESGNVFSSFVSGKAHLWVKATDENSVRDWSNEIQVGNKVTLRGTVKAHSEFKGIKETQLSRIQFLSRTVA